MRQAARVYMETQITTTSQGQVLIMLYDGAIKFLNQAKERIDAKDYVNKGKLISCAIDIINELASSLNPEKGGALAENLNQLYFYCNKRLFMANSRMDTVPIDEVIKILGGIRSAYAQIMDTPEAVAAMEQAAVTAAATAKNPRAPIGVQSAPTGVPVHAAKVRNAYAVQHATAATPFQPQMDHAEPTVLASAPVVEEEVEIPVSAPTNLEMPPVTDFPDLASASFAQGKRAAASSLYRKFAG